MKIFLRAGAAAVLVSAAVLPSCSQIKITPVGSVSAMGGKYYLDSEESSLNARFDVFASPVVRFSENSELLPVYSGNYSGTQDVQELAGGGVLTRQRQSHAFSLKYVYTDEFDKYKPRLSYSKALIRETSDEKWGDGLFDYSTLSFGFEAEQERPHGTFTESYDYFKVAYPNYSTLLSQSQSVFNDTDTFNQLSTNAGENPLDNVTHRVAASYTWFPEASVMSAGYDLSYRTYGDQSIAANPGVGQPPFKSETRADVMQNAVFRVSRNLKPLLLSGYARAGWLSSNQNSYDSSASKFIKDYYSYMDLEIAPGFSLALKGGAQFGLNASWRKIFYLGRLRQNAAGAYGPDKINQTFWLTSVFARYPVYKKLFARAAYSYQVSSSNMRYEANYRYNYRTSTVLAGLEWEF